MSATKRWSIPSGLVAFLAFVGFMALLIGSAIHSDNAKYQEKLDAWSNFASDNPVVVVTGVASGNTGPEKLKQFQVIYEIRGAKGFRVIHAKDDGFVRFPHVPRIGECLRASMEWHAFVLEEVAPSECEHLPKVGT